MIGQPVLDDGQTVVRHEEELRIDREMHEVGRVRATKHGDMQHFEQLVPRDVEHAELEHRPAGESDSDQVETMADGSVSVSLFEERIFIEKRMVVRERIILRKVKVREEHLVEADLRKKRIEIETEGQVGNLG